MNDRKIRESLHDYVRGLVSDKEKKEIEAAIASSDSLQQDLKQVRAYYGALDEMEPIRASDDFLEKVHERIQARTGLRGIVAKLFFPLHIKVPLELFGVTATVLLVFFLYAPYVTQKPVLEGTRQKFAEENAPAPPAAAPENQQSAASSQAQAPFNALAGAKAKRSVKPQRQLRTAPAASAAPEPAVQQGAPEQTASGAAANANEPVAGLAAPAPAPSDMSKTKAELAYVRKDAMRKAQAEEAAVPASSPGAPAPSGYASQGGGGAEKNLELSEKQALGAKKMDKISISLPEVLAQWSFSTGMQTRASRLKGKPGREEFLKVLFAENKADVKWADSLDYRIYSIVIQSKHLAPFLDSLRTRGDLMISGSVLSETSSDNVRVILKTAH